MNHKVAFVVVGWNNLELLKECFESIYDQTYKNLSCYYVDNNSKDNSVAYVKENFPNIEIIQPGKNTGFAIGNNLGITTALSEKNVEYIALLNTDARIDRRWVDTIIEFAKQKPKGALYQGTTLDYYDHEVIDSTHTFIAHNGQGTQGGWRYYIRGENGPKKVFGVNAAACIISRGFIDAQPFGTNIFDEAFFMYLEDVDLAARATVLGWDNYLVPGAHAYHMGSASSGKNPGFSLYMTFRNNNAMLFKNFTLKENFKIAPKLVRGDIDTIKTLRHRGQKKAAWAVVRGRTFGILRLPLYIWKRHKVISSRKIDADYLWKLMDKGY